MISKIMIIGSREFGTKNNPEALAGRLSDKGLSVNLIYWEDMELHISTGSAVVMSDGVDVFSSIPDLAITLGWYKNGKKSVYRDLAYSMALIMDSRGVKYWNSEMGSQRSTSKLSTMVQLALADIPVPSTVFSLQKDKLMRHFDMPFIAKSIKASRGNDNFLVDSSIIKNNVRASNGYFIVQEYLENDHDLRVICFGGKPALILRRSRDPSSKTHLNNTSQGGKFLWMNKNDIDSQILTLVSEISKITRREMAGVDLIPDSKSAYGYSCLEVNVIPQLTSGVDVDVKLDALVDILKNSRKEFS